MIKNGRKGRPVVNIRDLNDLLLSDAYSLPAQIEIIASLKDCSHIAVLDAAFFFYQWRVHSSYRHMLTMITHRGQEIFNVPVMGCMNSVAYVQRQIDRILRDFVRTYIDDIVTGVKSLADHIVKFRAIFALLVSFNIFINSEKTYLGYSSVFLLGQHVNSLGLSIDLEKLKAIALIKYPETIGDLKHWLGLTEYLRAGVHYYTQISGPLQDLKTLMLKSAPVAGAQRKAYALKTRLSSKTVKEFESFKILKDCLSKSIFLVHFTPKKRLWVDLDASKKWGFEVIVFHVVNEYLDQPGK